MAVINLLRGVASCIFIFFHVLFWASIILPLSLLKLITRGSLRDALDRINNFCAQCWVRGNRAWIYNVLPTKWQVQGAQRLDVGSWYLLISNHQSWVDIFVLQTVFAGKVPFLKFFLKQELIWVPLIGLVWWGLDFPFMKRYSKAYLDKHPEKRGKDVEMTRKQCEKFARVPTTVMNFVEGTRFTQDKHNKQASPYAHLLKPKAAGLSLAIESLGDQFNHLIDVTIHYPSGRPTFWSFFSGQLPDVNVHVQLRNIPAAYHQGDYLNDEVHRAQFQAWVNTMWAEKEQLMQRMGQGR